MFHFLFQAPRPSAGGRGRSRTRSASRRRQTTAPNVEQLESRATPSANPVIFKPDPGHGAAGELTINGSARNDVIKVLQSGDQLSVKVNGKRHGRFDAADIARIVVHGNNGADKITMHAAVQLPASIYGGRGNDVVRAGSGLSIIDGGAGNDRLFAGSARAFLGGGPGADRLVGGQGSDFLDGGAGKDQLNGGGGSNVLIGGPGNDRLAGNSSDNFLFQDAWHSLSAALGDVWNAAPGYAQAVWGSAATELADYWTSVDSGRAHPWDEAAQIQGLLRDYYGAAGPWDALFQSSMAAPDLTLAVDAFNSVFDPYLSGDDRLWSLGAAGLFGGLGIGQESVNAFQGFWGDVASIGLGAMPPWDYAAGSGIDDFFQMPQGVGSRYPFDGWFSTYGDVPFGAGNWLTEWDGSAGALGLWGSAATYPGWDYGTSWYDGYDAWVTYGDSNYGDSNYGDSLSGALDTWGNALDPYFFDDLSWGSVFNSSWYDGYSPWTSWTGDGDSWSSAFPSSSATLDPYFFENLTWGAGYDSSWSSLFEGQQGVPHYQVHGFDNLGDWIDYINDGVYQDFSWDWPEPSVSPANAWQSAPQTPDYGALLQALQTAQATYNQRLDGQRLDGASFGSSAQDTSSQPYRWFDFDQWKWTWRVD
ncbi:MAG: hypothetical protein L0Y71_01595 [Gemmataceae bacterium]|nr:hypothetical protein [Gemmataceae bacterium]